MDYKFSIKFEMLRALRMRAKDHRNLIEAVFAGVEGQNVPSEAVLALENVC